MRKLTIKVIGPETDYATYTLYLWFLTEVIDILRSELSEDVEVEINWIKDIPEDGTYPKVLINGDEVLVGIPSDPGYVYESIRSYLVRRGIL
ncbi:MAG: hypothetical protein DRJ40_10590 [Thermoprotei archaeon]|nr:MAG: hypothetical protein DRJ40_10590 [Thermoprotei archaeon]